jgi:drug/metabolite transporter (DMT)-like permease
MRPPSSAARGRGIWCSDARLRGGRCAGKSTPPIARTLTAPLAIRLDHQANLIGSLWMVAAMAGFAVEDALLKVVSRHLPVGEVMILFGLCGAALFAALSRARNEPLYRAEVISYPMRIRVVFEIVGRLFYVLALALTPLSSATAILQATPIVVVMGAALFFGEKVGWMRWTAIVVGLLGVLIVLKPAAGSFSALSFLAVLGMLGFAGRDLASRAAPLTLPTTLLGLYGFLAIVLAGGGFALWDARPFALPHPTTALALAGAVVIGVFSYNALMTAMRIGEVSTVTPFRYSRLLFGVTLGILLFGEKVDLSMIVGCLIIVAAGLFILWRGRVAARAQNPA